MSPLHHLPQALRYLAITLSPVLLAPSAMASGFTSLSGDYYNGYFGGDPSYFSSNTKAFTRQDHYISFTDSQAWASGFAFPTAEYATWDFTGTSLDGVSDYFSVRWTGSLQIDQAGTYNFRTQSDDAIIGYIDNQLFVYDPTVHAPKNDLASLFLTEGSHSFEFLYGENGGGSMALLQWQKPGDSDFSTIRSQQVPGPLPLLGLATAFKTSRILRRRLKARIS